MTADLSGCVMKLRRAEHHRKDFERLSEEFYKKRKAYSFVPDSTSYDLDKDRLTIGLKVTNRPRALPRYLSLVLGDYTQNLRAALDHLAYQIAVVNMRRPLTPEEARATEFPIFDVDSKFTTWAAMKYRPALFGPARASLDRLQPYYGGNNPLDHPLWWLSTLSNIDKHRLLLLIRPTAQHVTYVPRTGAGSGRARVIGPRGAKRGTKHSFEFIGTRVGAGVEVRHKTTTGVVLRDTQVAFVGDPYEALAEVRRFIKRKVFPEFQGTVGKLPRVR